MKKKKKEKSIYYQVIKFLNHSHHTLFMTKMAKIDTLFMAKTAEKPYPLGPHIPV